MIEPDAPETPARAAVAAAMPWHLSVARDALARRTQWPHALLVAGAAGIGKEGLALTFARALLCEQPSPDGFACGRCASCGYVEAGQHPDLHRVEPIEYDEDGVAKRLDFIPIEAIRLLTRFTQLTSHRRVAKVALIVPAERMHPTAANALLKTLEEPPAGTCLMLVAHQPGRLPATVLSRCSRLDLPLPPRDEALRWLAEHGIADPAAVLAQAGGAPLAALRIADPARQAERAVWLTALASPRRLLPAMLAARIDQAPREERKDRLGDALDWLLDWTADLARIAAGGMARRNPDHAAALGALAPKVARVGLSRYHRSLLRQRVLVTHPLAPRLVAAATLVEYRALFD